MPSYHSQFNDKTDVKDVCGMAILPLKTRVKGPAMEQSGSGEDIIDEAIKLFRANVLFASFEIKAPADRTLVFLTLFISQCLNRMTKAGNKASASKIMFDLAKEKFPLPGESGWLLGGHILKPKGRSEEDTCRNYMRQLREETCNRMVEVLYKHNDSAPNKFWMGFSKRKFMGLTVR